MGSIKMQDVACNYSSTSGNWAWASGLTNVNNENIYKTRALKGLALS